MSHHIRKARVSDSSILLRFIKELAAYEKLEDQVVATEKDIELTLFGEAPKAEVLILEVDDEPAGFVLFFYNYSTFLCQYGLYIEDLYVREAYRGLGYGRALLREICQLARERNCGRVEWWTLDWNKPAIDFYLKLGAEAMNHWTVYRLNKDQIKKLTSDQR